MAHLNVNIGKLPLKNPVLTASGTFGYGLEFADFIDLNRLGGYIEKGLYSPDKATTILVWQKPLKECSTALDFKIKA